MKHVALLLCLLSVAAAYASAQTPTAPTPPTSTPSATPTPPPTDAPDLVVEAITIVGPQPMWTHGQATAPTVRATVRNQGSAPSGPYRLDFEWVGSSTGWLNGNEAGSFEIEDTSLEEDGGTAAMSMPWTLQPSQAGAGAIRVTISTVGDPNQANNVRQNPLFIPVRDVRLTAAGSAQVIHPDETRFVRFTLQNAGNMEEPVSLAPPIRVTGPPGRLEATLDQSSFTLLPGQTARGTLFVAYPYAGDSSPFAIAYRLDASAMYGRALQATTATFTDDHDGERTVPNFALTRTDDAPLLAASGHDLVLSFTLANEGSDQDIYDVSAQIGEGWVAAASVSRVALEKEEVKNFTVRVAIPQGVPLGSKASLDIQAQSVHGEQPASARLDIRVRGPVVRVSGVRDGPPEAVYVGDEARLRVHVLNEGTDATAPQSEVVIRATGLTEAATLRTISVARLDGGVEQNFLVDFGQFTKPGTASFAGSWNSPGSSLASQGFDASTFVRKSEFVVEAPAGLAGVPGEVVSYRAQGKMFRVVNNGNSAETLSLFTTARQGKATLPEGFDQLTIAPGEIRSVPLDHALPLPAGRHTRANATLEVQIHGRPDVRWNATVETHVQDVRAPEVEAPSIPSLWTLNEPMVVEVSARDDGAVVRVVAIHRAPSGSVRSFDLELRGSGWSGTTLPVETGNHSIVVRATDAAGHTAESPTRYVEVRAIPGPILLLLGPGDAANIRANDIYTVLVNDTLPLRSVRLRVFDSFNNTLVTRLLRPSADGNRSFDLEGVAFGRVGITLEATNDAGARTVLTRTANLVPKPTDAPGAPQEVPSPSLSAPATPGVGLLPLLVVLLAVGASASRSRRQG